ncbi:MAG: YbjN domain-containing protein [Polyangiales bacterium]
MASVEEVHQHIIDILNEANVSYEVNKGRIRIVKGSAAVFIKVESWINNHTVVELVCPVLKGVERTPALLEKLDHLNFGLFFGKAYTHDSGVWIAHNLLGDHLDPEELLAAVGLIARVADKLDDELKGEFGGQRYSE